jgi:hypothetical protein
VKVNISYLIRLLIRLNKELFAVDKKYVTSFTETYLQNLAVSRYGAVVQIEMNENK